MAAFVEQRAYAEGLGFAALGVIIREYTALHLGLQAYDQVLRHARVRPGIGMDLLIAFISLVGHTRKDGICMARGNSAAGRLVDVLSSIAVPREHQTDMLSGLLDHADQEGASKVSRSCKS